MSAIQEVLYRLRKGPSERALARDLGLARMTSVGIPIKPASKGISNRAHRSPRNR